MEVQSGPLPTIVSRTFDRCIEVLEGKRDLEVLPMYSV